ncbi:MAG: prepilin-type N-terminal cleavage/methylation domain-containing protein [Actinobacteria bacterium]|nr:prepilin-type N-terminal cleavage/methylation domain-containing protein [Actinomycetota bacterium]
MKAFNDRRAAAGQGGFTLIELLIVIAILGILAGVVVLAVGGVSDSAQTKACEIEGKSIETAIQAYKADQGVLPGSLAVLAPTYMKRDPSANWTLAGAEVTGIAPKCAGVIPD